MLSLFAYRLHRVWLPFFVLGPSALLLEAAYQLRGRVEGWFAGLEAAPAQPAIWGVALIWLAVYGAAGFGLWVYVNTAEGKRIRKGLEVWGLHLGLTVLTLLLTLTTTSPFVGLIGVVASLVSLVYAMAWMARHAFVAALWQFPLLGWQVYALYLAGALVGLNGL